ncbi:MAG: ArsI/CadI family heavy metal resistance metalloenzyme [Vulcanimicrobiota bacterium]
MATSDWKFHVSLNVTDLPRSLAFYRALTGLEPSKHKPDYARFELTEPPVVLTLGPGPVGLGHLNHIGFRCATSVELVEIQRRLEEAGVTTIREEGVECCYALQTKFWAHDPDGLPWEFYVFTADLEHAGDGRVPEAASSGGCCPG